MTNYEVLKQPGMLAAFFNSKFNGFPCGWCGMRSFEECNCVDRSTGCGFDWEEKFKTANRYSLNRMAKEIDRAISGACDICPVMDTCLEDGGRCVDTITEWLVQDNFMYDLCMSKKREVNMAETDLISRQAAIDELEHAAWGKEWDKALAKAMLESLPSAQPERKRGKWIDEAYDFIISGRCSVCGWEAHLYEDDVVGMNYCPNCGAKMDGFEEE